MFLRPERSFYSIGVAVALGLVLVSLSSDARAQGTTPKKPRVSGGLHNVEQIKTAVSRSIIAIKSRRWVGSATALYALLSRMARYRDWSERSRATLKIGWRLPRRHVSGSLLVNSSSVYVLPA